MSNPTQFFPIIQSAQTLTDLWADLGGEIPVSGYSALRLWINFDVNLSTDIRVRVLPKLKSERLIGAYTVDSGQGAAGSTSLKVDPNIAVDEPGEASGGVVHVFDVSSGGEHRYRYTSWSGDTFTLFSLSATADAGGSATSLVDADGNFISNGVQVGDIVYNSTESAYAYVVNVTATTLTTTNVGSDTPITDWSTDAYVVGGTVVAYTTSDKVHVPTVKYSPVIESISSSVISVEPAYWELNVDADQKLLFTYRLDDAVPFVQTQVVAGTLGGTPGTILSAKYTLGWK